MPVIPGGKIIGGMGGRIYVGTMGRDPSFFSGQDATTEISTVEDGGGDPGFLDVEQWTISRQWINAECTHSGTYGAITRRNVAFDWHFQASLPADQANMPDRLFGPLNMDEAEFINLSVAFFLGDVVINEEAKSMDMEQKFYYAPMCIIRSIQPVLSAARDVIRYQITGEGNSRLWLIPDEQEDCTRYISYLKTRGWWV